MKIAKWFAIGFIALHQPALANGGGYFDRVEGDFVYLKNAV